MNADQHADKAFGSAEAVEAQAQALLQTLTQDNLGDSSTASGNSTVANTGTAGSGGVGREQGKLAERLDAVTALLTKMEAQFGLQLQGIESRLEKSIGAVAREVKEVQAVQAAQQKNSC